MLFSNFYSPLEQFEIIPLYPRIISSLDLSLTNQTLIILVFLFFVMSIAFSSVKQTDFSLFIIPTKIQSIVEFSYNLILNMVVSNVQGKLGQKFFPLIFSLFMFLGLLNLIGLIPYSYTVTTHFVVTVALSSTFFLGINIISFVTYGFKFFSLFLPAGTPYPLALLLVPVEFFLYFFRPFSLAIRLFCNMMSGHILLKIFVGFGWSLMGYSGVLFLFHFLPLLTLLPLIGLELCVALIQSFVFSLLICIYLNDALNLHN